MSKTFVTNLILLVGLNLLVKPFYLLVVETEIQNRVGADVFGSYFALINFTFILNILPDLGTTNWNTRKIAQEGQIHAHHFQSLLMLRLVLAAIYLLFSMLIGYFLHYSNWQLFILLVLSFNQVLVSGILYLRSYLTGMHMFRSDSIISVLDRLLLALMMIVLLWGGIMGNNNFNIEWLVWGQTISYSFTLLVAVSMVMKKTKKQIHRFELHYLKIALKESFPFALLIFLSMLAYRIDSVMLERLSGSQEAGIYAMGFRFFEAVNMISYLFAVLLLPIYTRLLSKGEEVASMVQLSFKILFSGTFIISVISCLYATPILQMVYDNNVFSASSPFAWLMVSALFFSLQYVSGTLITASGKMKPMIYIALGGMVYNIILNLLYIPEQGALGAAKACCFTQLIILIGQIGVIAKNYELGNLKKLGIQTTLFICISLFAGFALSTDMLFSTQIPYSGLLVLLAMFIAALVTRMLDIRKIPELIRLKINHKS